MAQPPPSPTIYRPQSPDLSGLGAPAQPSFQPHHTNHNPLPFTDSAYTTSFAPTSIPATIQHQPHFGYPQPQYNMPPSGIKAEDDEYMPDAQTRRTRNPPQAYIPNGSSHMDFPQAPQMQIKDETPRDPTHGVVLKTSFPVARIKRIMQADEDIGKVAQVTPHAVSRALELFMIKLITASADQARGGPAAAAAASKGPKRVLAQHLKRAIQADETFDFLTDIIAKVPDAPAAKAKKEPLGGGSDSEEPKPKPVRKGRKRKDSGDDV